MHKDMPFCKPKVGHPAIAVAQDRWTLHEDVHKSYMNLFMHKNDLSPRVSRFAVAQALQAFRGMCIRFEHYGP